MQRVIGGAGRWYIVV